MNLFQQTLNSDEIQNKIIYEERFWQNSMVQVALWTEKLSTRFKMDSDAIK